jgi:CDP-diglyceride synthetase
MPAEKRWQNESAKPSSPPRCSPIRTVSGIIALILGVLAVINIGGCVNAKSDLAKMESGSNTADSVALFVDTVRGFNEGDPLRGVAGMIGQVRKAQQEAEGFQSGAWLCILGFGVSAVVFSASGRR